VRDRMAGPENGLFFPIRPNKMLWRMKVGDKPDVPPLLRVEKAAKRALHTNSATGSE
jgi:hypothetical protein